MKAIYTRALTLRTLLFLVTIPAFFWAPLILSAGQTAVPPKPVPQPSPQTLDGLFAAVAKQVPEFGGMSFGPDEQTIQVYLTVINRQKVSDVQRAVVGVFGAGIIPRKGIKALKGEYGFLQLREWYTRMVGPILGIPGVTLTDIDEAKNRLGVGIEKKNMEARVVEQLARLKIPRNAIVITVTGPIKALSHTLNDAFSPRQGGCEITRLPCSGSGIVTGTLGFNAHRLNVPGFVTNSHNTGAFWSLDTLVNPCPACDFYQAPGFVPAEWVGTESVDTQAFPCPAPYLSADWCRYSDSAFVRYNTGVTSALGIIDKTTGPTVLSSSTANLVLTVDHAAKFKIVGAPTQPYLVGLKLHKVGRTTGWTTGSIAGTCVDYAGTSTATQPGTTIRLCQYLVADPQLGLATFGDSGSPVFRVIDSQCGHVELYGLLWGGGDFFIPPAPWSGGSVGKFFVFSPIGGVSFQQTGVQSPQDLGPLNYVAEAPYAVSPPSDIAHWWPLDESMGSKAQDVVAANGDFVGGRDGTTRPGPLNAPGSPVSVPGKVGNAFAFDGKSAVVEVPDGPGTLSFGNLEHNFSIDAWIKVATTDKSGIRPIVDKRVEIGNSISGYAFFLSDGRLGFELADGVAANPICGPATSTTTSCTNYVSNVDVANGKWHHVAVTVQRTGTTPLITLYVDCSVVLTGTARLNSNNNGALLIGSGYPIVIRKPFFKGAIDELTIFGRALTQPEIQSICNAGGAGKCR